MKQTTASLNKCINQLTSNALKVEILEEELSNRGAALCVLEEENEALRGTCDKARRLSEHTNSTNNKLEDEITTSK